MGMGSGKNGFFESRLFRSFPCPHSLVDPGQVWSLRGVAAGGERIAWHGIRPSRGRTWAGCPCYVLGIGWAAVEEWCRSGSALSLRGVAAGGERIAWHGIRPSRGRTWAGCPCYVLGIGWAAVEEWCQSGSALSLRGAAAGGERIAWQGIRASRGRAWAGCPCYVLGIGWAAVEEWCRSGSASLAKGRREVESGSRGRVFGRRGEGHGQDAHATLWELAGLR